MYLENGKVIRVEGDPDFSFTRGKLCKRGFAAVERLYHPNRLKYPLKRVGKRGEGKWQRISWDEALDTIAEKLNSAKEKYGAESVAFVQGAPKGFVKWVNRLANVFGSPNMSWPDHVCYTPTLVGATITS
ncbi:unnamed protein product, partial [marine sediment metagenome]